MQAVLGTKSQAIRDEKHFKNPIWLRHQNIVKINFKIKDAPSFAEVFCKCKKYSEKCKDIIT